MELIAPNVFGGLEIGILTKERGLKAPGYSSTPYTYPYASGH